jgi:chromosome segregation ATPase
MLTWTEFSDRYFQWWQTASSRYLEIFTQEPFLLRGMGFSMERSLEFKKVWDQAIEETWRNFRLPPLEEIIRLQERINHLETRLVDLHERDWGQEVTTAILETGGLAAKEDLKALKKTLANLEKQMAGAPELERLKQAVAKVKANLDSLARELGTIKEAVTQLDPKLSTLEAVCEKLAKKASAKTPVNRA